MTNSEPLRGPGPHEPPKIEVRDCIAGPLIGDETFPGVSAGPPG
jgi:hypothetical protein